MKFYLDILITVYIFIYIYITIRIEGKVAKKLLESHSGIENSDKFF